MTGPFGAFGKIPALGDFMRLNVPAGFVQPWDDWMQTGMLAVRDSLGADWDSAYLSAPIWRFSLAAGCAGPRPVLGIFMASVDRVGRQYPLTLAAPHDAGTLAQTHFANTSVFEHLEQIALAMLDDQNTRDTLTEALAPLTVLTVPEGGLPYAGAIPPEHVLAGTALAPHLGAAQAIWSTAMQGDHRLMTTPDLPSGAQMRALFDLTAPAWGTAPMAALTT